MEKIRKLENRSSVELSEKLADLDSRKSLVKKVNLFSNDENDEFKVLLSNGKKIGIFKTWAVPAIPLLESGMGAADATWDVVEQWKKELEKKPILAWETMEKWRSRSEIFDRRLLAIFNERVLPENKEERIAELFLRLKIAFAFAAPFYHIEAMVGDGNNTPGNPFAGDLGKEESGGFLDMAGMLLPSALGDMVSSDKLNWNDLNWSKVENQIASNTSLEKMAMLMRVARMAGVKTEEVLFAANALEWIPVSVGGKKGDLVESEATKQLLESDVRTRKINIGTVARDMNGLVRFLNWTPLIKNEVNFSEAAWWKYSAACETSNQIISELLDGSLIAENHREEFVNTVLPQLRNLDASSARGRFALWMFENGWFDGGVVKTINSKERKTDTEMMSRMIELENTESVINLGESNNRFLVGGKAAGLLEAAEIFGKEFVGDGVVITSEAVSKWLVENPTLASLMRELNKESNVENKLEVAGEIRSIIKGLSFPETIADEVRRRIKSESLAVRSSSFDEDTLVNGSAAGIYESETDVDREDLGKKIVNVISSFFSEKAVSYRHLHNLSDDPAFAVLIHEFLPGAGGVVFSKGDGDGWSVFTGGTPGDVVGGDNNFDKVEKVKGKLSSELKHGWVDKNVMETIGSMAVLAETVLGGMTDMEFVVSEKGLRILQLRMLNSAEEKGVKVKANPKKWFPLAGIDNLGTVVFAESSVGLIIGEDVNIEQFQGELFRCLVKNKDRVSAVSLAHKIPRTSHFANICLNLGIKLIFRDE